MRCSERESSHGVPEDVLDETTRNSRYRSRRNSDVCVSLALSDMQQAAFFKGRSEVFINTVMDFFQLETFMEGEFIMREGDIGDKLLFLHRGRVDVLVGSSMVKVATLGHGTIFGEMALLGAPKRTATIRAAEFCDCRSLDKHTFQRLLRKFPEERAVFEVMAKERMEALTQVKEKEASSFRSASQRRFSSSKERADALTQAKEKETSRRDSSVRRRSILPPRLEEQVGKAHFQHKPPALSRRPHSSRSSSISSRKTELPSLPSSAISSRTSTAHSLPAMMDCSADIWNESDEVIQVGRQQSRRVLPEPNDYDRTRGRIACVQSDEMSTSMTPFFDINTLNSLASTRLASPKAGKCAPLDSMKAPMTQKEIANHKFLLFDHMALNDFTWDMPDVQFSILCTA